MCVCVSVQVRVVHIWGDRLMDTLQHHTMALGASLLTETTGKVIQCPESESESRSVMSDSLRPHGLYSPWNSPGQNTGVGSLSLLQGIFPTQGSNPGLPHCRRILYWLSHQGSPTMSRGQITDMKLILLLLQERH